MKRTVWLFVPPLLCVGAVTASAGPQSSGLPPPYDGMPGVIVAAGGSPVLARGEITTDLLELHGVAKVARIWLQTDKTSRIKLVKQGSTVYKLTELGPRWTFTDIHRPLGPGVRFYMRYQVLPNARMATTKKPYCYTMTVVPQNGRLKNPTNFKRCFRIVKSE